MRRFADYLRSGQEAGQLRADLPAELIAEAFFALTSSFVMDRIATGSLDLAHDDKSVRLVDQLMVIFWTGAAGPAVREGDTWTGPPASVHSEL